MKTEVRIIGNENYRPKRFPMNDMEPLQICKTLDGKIVMRTQSLACFEIMDLSCPVAGGNWLATNNSIIVEELPPGFEVKFIVKE